MNFLLSDVWVVTCHQYEKYICANKLACWCWMFGRTKQALIGKIYKMLCAKYPNFILRSKHLYFKENPFANFIELHALFWVKLYLTILICVKISTFHNSDWSAQKMYIFSASIKLDWEDIYLKPLSFEVPTRYNDWKIGLDGWKNKSRSKVRKNFDNDLFYKFKF